MGSSLKLAEEDHILNLLNGAWANEPRMIYFDRGEIVMGLKESSFDDIVARTSDEVLMAIADEWVAMNETED